MKKTHFQQNVKKHEIEKEVLTPSQLEKMEEPRMLMLIYKAVFYCLSVLLDIRWNTSHLKNTKGKNFSNKKVENPVIKEHDLKKLKDR